MFKTDSTRVFDNSRMSCDASCKLLICNAAVTRRHLGKCVDIIVNMLISSDIILISILPF